MRKLLFIPLLFCFLGAQAGKVEDAYNKLKSHVVENANEKDCEQSFNKVLGLSLPAEGHRNAFRMEISKKLEAAKQQEKSTPCLKPLVILYADLLKSLNEEVELKNGLGAAGVSNSLRTETAASERAEKKPAAEVEGIQHPAESPQAVADAAVLKTSTPLWLLIVVGLNTLLTLGSLFLLFRIGGNLSDVDQVRNTVKNIKNSIDVASKPMEIRRLQEEVQALSNKIVAMEQRPIVQPIVTNVPSAQSSSTPTPAPIIYEEYFTAPDPSGNFVSRNRYHGGFASTITPFVVKHSPSSEFGDLELVVDPDTLRSALQNFEDLIKPVCTWEGTYKNKDIRMLQAGKVIRDSQGDWRIKEKIKVVLS